MKPSTKNSKIHQDNSFYQKLTRESDISIDADHNWLITLSDVLLLLLVFFILLNLMPKDHEKKTPSMHGELINDNKALTGLSYAPDDAIRKISKEMTDAVKNLNMGEDVLVQTVNKVIIITIKERITFKSGEAEILKESEPVLDEIAGIVTTNPLFMVEISGHTDNTPIHNALYPSNWELSMARATSVLKYLLNKNGIDPSRCSIKGNAAQKPLVANDSDELKAINRRVEIRLIENPSHDGEEKIL